MININEDFFKGKIPESKIFTNKDANNLEISKIEVSIEGFNRQIDEIDFKLREIELEHQTKEYDPETFNIVKQLTTIRRKIALTLLSAKNRLRELKESME